MVHPNMLLAVIMILLFTTPMTHGQQIATKDLPPSRTLHLLAIDKNAGSAGDDMLSSVHKTADPMHVLIDLEGASIGSGMLPCQQSAESAATGASDSGISVSGQDHQQLPSTKSTELSSNTVPLALFSSSKHPDGGHIITAPIPPPPTFPELSFDDEDSDAASIQEEWMSGVHHERWKRQQVVCSRYPTPAAATTTTSDDDDQENTCRTISQCELSHWNILACAEFIQQHGGFPHEIPGYLDIPVCPPKDVE